MLLKGALVARLYPAGVAKNDLRIDGDTIIERGIHLRPRSNETVEDATGLLVLPGHVCAHTHAYSALSRGMPGPPRRPTSFPDMLRKIWWTLDEALDDEAIHYSALVAALDAVRTGTTTLVDHHSSPNAIAGSLDIIRGAFSSVGVRSVLCYEVTDRGGRARRDAGLAENDRFLSASRTDTMARGLVGAHASFTLSDLSLAAVGELAGFHQVGVHIHAAEAREDVDLTAKRHCCSVVDRLAKHGALVPGSVLAHGVHLAPAEMRRVDAADAWLVHNPRSNMNNGVGRAAVEHFGACAALGTDGWPADMLEEARMAHFGLRERVGALAGDVALRLLGGSQRLASELFGLPFGVLEPGAPADLVVYDYPAPSPIDASTMMWHGLAGLHAGRIKHVMAAGRWIVRDGEVTTVDVEAVYARAARAAARLWVRMRG